jgi:hypothetical protein
LFVRDCSRISDVKEGDVGEIWKSIEDKKNIAETFKWKVGDGRAYEEFPCVFACISQPI